LLLTAAGVFASVIVVAVSTPGNGKSATHYVEEMGEEVDHIMIGAAETAYFGDSIKKKVDVDLQTTEEIVGRAQRTAQTTEQFTAKAEWASKAAADVRSESEIQQIADASRGHVETTPVIADVICCIRNRMLATEDELPRAATSATLLSECGEMLFEVLSHSNAKTSHDDMRDVAQQAAKDVGKLFEQAIASGQISEATLFDRTCKQIPNTNPPKHKTAFDAFADKVLPAIQEPILEKMPHIACAGAVDNNGYIPTHIRKFSKQLTGNYDVDLVNNRTKRIYNGRAGARCGSSIKPFLVQTYKRDTGEVMHDVSVPINVNASIGGGGLGTVPARCRPRPSRQLPR
jgi:methyl-accepting chemotaxis protein